MPKLTVHSGRFPLNTRRRIHVLLAEAEDQNSHIGNRNKKLSRKLLYMSGFLPMCVSPMCTMCLCGSKILKHLSACWHCRQPSRMYLKKIDGFNESHSRCVAPSLPRALVMSCRHAVVLSYSRNDLYFIRKTAQPVKITSLLVEVTNRIVQ